VASLGGFGKSALIMLGLPLGSFEPLEALSFPLLNIPIFPGSKPGIAATDDVLCEV
jgi:hypothetical protein